MAVTPTLVTPATLLPLLKAAKPGASFKLSADDFGHVVLKGLTFPIAVVIDASAASLTSLRIESCAGIHWTGGAAAGGSTLGYGLHALLSRDIRFTKVAISDTNRAILFDRCQDFAAIGNALTRLVIDGINIALSQRGVVALNTIWGFNTGLAHPDGIQLWSRPGGITADILVERNVLVDCGQGVTAFNHVRAGINDGGFDRVIFRDNTVRSRFPQGIALYDGRDCVVTGNDVAAIAGSRVKPGGAWTKASINTPRTTGEIWGNLVPDVPGSPAARARPA